MTNWLIVAIAAFVLWLPAYYPSRTRKFLHSKRAQADARFPNMLAYWPNWLDLIRAAAGAGLLKYFAFDPTAASGGNENQVLMITGAILLIGVGVQCWKWSGKLIVIAPLFYMIGIGVILPGWLIGGFALVVGLLVSLAQNRLGWLLPAMIAATGICGYVIVGIDKTVLLTCILLTGPLAVAFVAHGPIVYPVRLP